MIYFGDVPSVYQLDTIRQMVGPALAPRVNAQNSAALAGRDVLEKTGPGFPSADWPRINEYFARLVEDRKPPADGWMNMFTLLEYPAAWMANLAQKQQPVTEPNTAAYVGGKNRLIHKRIPVASVRREAFAVQA